MLPLLVVVFAVDEDEGSGLLTEEQVLARMEKRHGKCAILRSFSHAPPGIPTHFNFGP